MGDIASQNKTRTILAMLLAVWMVGSGCADDKAPPGNNVDPGNNAPNNAPNNTVNNAPCPQEPEICDGADDDCDGLIDEDFDLQGDVQNCGACAEVCDLPNGQVTCRAGQCALVGCEEGFFDVDGDPDNGCESTQCSPDPAGETCDGADNDCDGQIDEDFNVGSSVEHCGGCGQACSLPGAQEACDNGTCVIDACEPGFADEDGDPDNGCEAVVCQPEPDGEICDGADNDCDGQIDEDFDLQTDAEHCGQCGQACTLDNAVAACDAGQCTVDQCEGGFVDLNGQAEDGCEYLCEAQDRAEEDIACDGQDNDCDGEIDNDTQEGLPCALGGMAGGTQTCVDGALLCSAPESEETLLCGPVDGVLTLAGSPYIITCEAITIEGIARLEAGVEVRSGLPEGTWPQIQVTGQIISQGATWDGVEVLLDGGTASLQEDRFVGHGQVVLSANEAATVDATDVIITSDNGGVGVRLTGPGRLAEGFAWANGTLSGLEIGVEVLGDGPITLQGTIFEDNANAVRVDAEDAALDLSQAVVRNQQGPPARGIALEEGATVSIEGTRFEGRAEDAALTLPIEALADVSGAAIQQGASTIHITGDVAAAVTLEAVGQLDVFTLIGPMQVLSGATLDSAAVLLQSLSGQRLSVLSGGAWTAGLVRNVAVTLGGQLTWQPEGALEITNGATGLQGCALDVAATGSLAQDALVLRHLNPSTPALDGLCLRTPNLTGLQAAEGMTIEGFERGVVVDGAVGEVDVRGLTLLENRVGLDYAGQVGPVIAGNTFRSVTDRQMTAIHFSQLGAEPGGAVTNNIFDFDLADGPYHLDPDNLSTNNGTRFEGNTWLNNQPDGYLLSGTLESPQARLQSVTELPFEDNFFISIQMPGPLTINEGAHFQISPVNQIATIQGLTSLEGDAEVVVLGRLTMAGPGALANNMPIRFEPGSQGTIRRAEISGQRTDAPLISITDAAPLIGGVGSVDANILTGSSQGDVIGIELNATAPMCVEETDLCPFIANNDLRTLAIGIVVTEPADFSGVNDFDDANPNGDTVPINVQRLPEP